MSMKAFIITFFTIILCLTSSVGWSLTIEDLVKREGIYYKKFSDKPFTGDVNGLEQGSFINGKKEGSWKTYYLGGQLRMKLNYKNGLIDGTGKDYYINGKLNIHAKWKNDKLDGLFLWYNKDGTLDNFMSGTFKNGKKIKD